MSFPLSQQEPGVFEQTLTENGLPTDIPNQLHVAPESAVARVINFNCKAFGLALFGGELFSDEVFLETVP